MPAESSRQLGKYAALLLIVYLRLNPAVVEGYAGVKSF
ncbi:hypothetical protein Slin_4009 [Spirosoma linguale DSM 74]|uniref:Uncharacterized protein n=1 Tax=Spirosoma linguale (strain ATCC 33905 / DSM 74 / LMG 10896 / Claus 1) TaxID=504472 RepID=D2QIS3_SPILD|nr:hypothetical protein Slin_4009 [Spirosoma linguale DSM 74]